MRRLVASGGLALLLALALASCSALPSRQAAPLDNSAGTVLDPPQELNDFTLTSHTGASLSLSDLRGRPALLFFGYTNCPDVCPATLVEWKKIKNMLGGEAEDVEWVFISVDSERDTPDVLARYVGGYDPAFTGLSGDKATLQAMAKDYGLYFEPSPRDGDGLELVDHGSYSYLINPEGRLQKIYSYGVPADVIAQDLRALLPGS